MNKSLSPFARILILIISFGLIAGFIFVMVEVEKRIEVKIELGQWERKNKNLDFQKQSQVIITEVMSSNSLTILDGFGSSSDWIELHNPGDEVINLKDAGLSTNIDDPMMWVFPDFEIGSGEYRIVYASGVNEVDDSGNLHLNFKLNAAVGETLYFTSALGTLMSSIEIPPLESDISYGVDESGAWRFFNHPTPNEKNGLDGQGTQDFKVYIDSPLMITEYMTNNRSVLYDEDGDFVDWVEFYNDSDKPFSLAQLYFSDDKTDLRKWSFPNTVIEPNSYLVVFASGKDKVTENLHTNFRLSAFETLVISTQYREVLVELDILALPEGVSAGQNGDGLFGYFAVPTPGQENSKRFSTTMDITAERDPKSGIIINEFMSNNRYGILDAYGKSSDWIEIFNPTDTDVPLIGFSLSDDAAAPLKWLFPKSAVLSAGEYLVVFASGNDEVINGEYHTNFSLSANDDVILLSEPNGAVADSMVVEQLPGNVSKGRTTDGEIAYFSDPTPGRINDTHPINHLDSEANIILEDLYISEIAASKINLNRGGYRGLLEYIELFNDGSKEVNLSGYSISVGPDSEFFFENISIQGGQYLVLHAKGGIPAAGESIQIEDIRINGAGETLLLKDNTGKIIDRLETGYILGDYSFGRSADNKYKEVIFDTKTPGSKNSDKEFSSINAKPTFSAEGGMVSEESILVELNAEPGTIIKYTTNGIDPTTTSRTYSQPITVNQNTVIRAIAISDGKLPSAIASRTYIFDKTHDIPILCISSDNYGLFSYDYGIYAAGKGHTDSEFPYYSANYWWDAERPVSIEYYETDGKLALDFNAGIQIYGGFSRALPQKSLIIHMRDEYGLDELYYPFFEGSDVNLFKDLILRNGGQDTRTRMKDLYISKSAIEEGNQDGMRGQPVAVYINGEYWGLYNLRERINADYLSHHYHLDTDNINIIASNGVALHGNNEDWLQLKEFCINNDFTIQENYETLANWIDIENFTDYIILQTFFSNTDSGNIKFWRDESKTMKWRVLFYDVDVSLRDNSYHLEMIKRMFGLSGGFIGFSPHIQKALIQNPQYQQYFLQRYAYYLREVFTDEYLESGIDKIADTMKNEMVYQTQRWEGYGSYDQWLESVEIFKINAMGRGEIVAELLQNFLNVDDDEMMELIPWYQPGQ
jgi:hypothetical protein